MLSCLFILLSIVIIWFLISICFIGIFNVLMVFFVLLIEVNVLWISKVLVCLFIVIFFCLDKILFFVDFKIVVKVVVFV